MIIIFEKIFFFFFLPSTRHPVIPGAECIIKLKAIISAIQKVEG